jgi:hypothetical protein
VNERQSTLLPRMEHVVNGTPSMPARGLYCRAAQPRRLTYSQFDSVLLPLFFF